MSRWTSKRAERRRFLRKLVAVAIAPVTAAMLPLIVKPRTAKGSPVSEEVATKTETMLLKQGYAAQAHRSLDDTMTRQGIENANAAGDAVLLEVAAPLNQMQAATYQTAVLLQSMTQTASIATDSTVEDPLARMQIDLQRALAKPVEQRKWGMVIDLRKCIGCSACTVACKAENKLPPGVVYRPVIANEVGTFPNVSMQFIPRPCMQCENPPCVPVCPVGATYRRPDGIVAIDYDVCIGCRYCVTACPYQARTFDWGLYYTNNTPRLEPYETVPSFEYGEEWPRGGEDSPIDNARKCHFCLHRLEAGMLPACVTTCIGRATYFGDLSDSQSLVSEFAGKSNVMRLKEDLGTEPKVYYLT